MGSQPNPAELLRFYIDAGADEAIGEAPLNRYQAKTPKDVVKSGTWESEAGAGAKPISARPALGTRGARGADPGELFAPVPAPGAAPGPAELAAASPTLEALAESMGRFEGFALKETATNLVFGDGNPEGDLMLIGEAPGADEDRQGLPFVGVSGQLLDRMLAAVGLDRQHVYITNVLHWRPPANRKPTTAEITLCLPFIERQIELVAPKILALLGGTAVSTLLGLGEGITKLRGRWLTYQRVGLEIPVMPTFHPAFLLRQPGLKREAWRDLLEIKAKLLSFDQKDAAE